MSWLLRRGQIVGRGALDASAATLNKLKTDPSASDVVNLISLGPTLTRSFDRFARRYPDLAKDVDSQLAKFAEESKKALSDAEKAVLTSAQARALQAELGSYAKDAKDMSEFVVRVVGFVGAPGPQHRRGRRRCELLQDIGAFVCRRCRRRSSMPGASTPRSSIGCWQRCVADGRCARSAPRQYVLV